MQFEFKDHTFVAIIAAADLLIGQPINEKKDHLFETTFVIVTPWKKNVCAFILFSMKVVYYAPLGSVSNGLGNFDGQLTPNDAQVHRHMHVSTGSIWSFVLVYELTTVLATSNFHM